MSRLGAGDFVALLMLIVALSGCSNLSKISVDDADLVPRARSLPYDPVVDARSLADPLVANGKTPGVSVGIQMPDGSRHYYGHGAISRDGAQPEPDTAAAVGSITKGWVGAVAGQMVADGELHWNDTLGVLLPPGTPLSADAARITLLELATHTSGLPRQPPTLETLRLFTGYLFTGNDFYRRLDHDRAYSYLREWRKPKLEAHEAPYSNVGYGLLANVLELKSGKPIDELVRDRIFRPLGMNRSAFGPGSYPDDQRMDGHAGDQPKFIRRGRFVEDWTMNGFMQGVGGGYSTTEDLLQYAAAHVAPAGPTTDLRATLNSEGPSIAWHTDPLGEYGVYYQFGVNSGHSAFVGIDTCRRITVVVLQNSFNWSDDVGRRLMRRIATAGDAAEAMSTERCGAVGVRQASQRSHD